MLEHGPCFAGVAAGDAVGGPGSGVGRCEYFVGDYDELNAQLDGFFAYSPHPDGDPIVPEPDDPVYDHPWAIIYCPAELYASDDLVLWDVIQLGDPPDPATMRRVAQQAATAPIPAPGFSPSSVDFQVVGLETWLWLDEAQTAPSVRTACIQPADYACVTVTATFVDVGADMGDGSDVVLCDGTGTPYDFALSYESQRDRDHCSHVYTSAPDESDTYPVTTATTWRVSYTCVYDSDLDGSYDSGCGGGFLGFVARLSAPEPLEVRDLQAVATTT